MDNRLIRRLSDAFAPLSAPYTLFDGRGRLLLGTVQKIVQPPLDLDFGRPVSINGALFIRVDAGDGFILMTDEAPGAHDNLLLASSMVKTLWEAQNTTGQREGGFRHLLLGEYSFSETEAFMAENRFPREMKRCVILLTIHSPLSSASESALRAILPLDEQDVLVSVGMHSAALIKGLLGGEQTDDLCEFAAAMQETALSEEGITLKIGIGEPVNTADALPQSYRQAHLASELGHIFHPEENVFCYHTMLFERFLYEIPPETAAAYRLQLFNKKTARLFTDEMLQTINTFLRKDLNMADTARQMYIHRNTLVYRLDKVQKQTGLDLRRFTDAMTFKLLFEMEKCDLLHPRTLLGERK